MGNGCRIKIWNILNTGSLGAFFEQWRCTPEERNLLVLYLAVIRLEKQLKELSRFIEQSYVRDGEGI
jgi:hypothetical protein